MAAKMLTLKQQRFVAEYLVDLNATQAAIRAGYSARTANEQGARLLANASVADLIQKAIAARSERTQITADKVLEQWWAIARANPNELVETRRTCCRYCHGRGHAYQRTAGEFQRDYAAWETDVAKAIRENKEAPLPFAQLGGDGYDARQPPHPECPECWGEGVERVFVKDTRLLSPEARRLYAGAKQTKDGIEIKMHDQAAALLNVAKHLGMLVDRTEITGKDGGPVEVQEVLVTTREEAKALLALMNGQSATKKAGAALPATD